MKLPYIIIFNFATLYTLYKYYSIRGWAKRPRRLCLFCRTVTKPDLTRDGTFVCMVCSHRGPVELSSGAAVDHFRILGKTPPTE